MLSVLATRSAEDAPELNPEEQKELEKRQKELGLEGTAKSETEQLEQLLERTNREILDRFEPTAFTGKQLISAGRQQQQNGSRPMTARRSPD